MLPRVGAFLDERRLLHGPWRSFERDVARLLIANGFDDVRVVGGSGDRGADILGVRRGELWVWQCKFTTGGPPSRQAIAEVVSAAQFYSADRLVVATSRLPGESFLQEIVRRQREGLNLQIAGPDRLLELTSGTPEFSPSRRVLRTYQAEASSRLHDALTDVGRAQMVMATGLGKTVIMADLVVNLLESDALEHGRVLVLAHTRELVSQLNRNFWYQLPKWVCTHQLSDGEIPSFWDGITFATIQGVQAQRETLPAFDLVIVDEAHHIGAESFRSVIKELNARWLLGATATPWRGDSYDIDLLLGEPVVRLGIVEGLQRGFLADVDYRLLADNVDWSVVQEISRNNYSLPQLNRTLIIPMRDEQASQIIREVFLKEGRRGAIVYSPTVVHANHFAGMLRHVGFKAESISSELSFRDRDALMTRLRAGRLDVIVTVDLFNEGVDVPDVDLIVFMRVTHSRRIFVQQLGRGLRLSPGKDKVIVLDFVTDLRRVAEVVDLDRSVRSAEVETLGLGSRLLQFRDASSGDFLREWILDQASLLLREGDSALEMPHLNFPPSSDSGGIE